MDAIADLRAEFERNREAHADMRGFIRDIVRRNELSFRQMIEESRANTREILSRLPPATA